MDGQNKGNPYCLMDDLGVPLFLETPNLQLAKENTWNCTRTKRHFQNVTHWCPGIAFALQNCPEWCPLQLECLLITKHNNNNRSNDNNTNIRMIIYISIIYYMFEIYT